MVYSNFIMFLLTSGVIASFVTSLLNIVLFYLNKRKELYADKHKVFLSYNLDVLRKLNEIRIDILTYIESHKITFGESLSILHSDDSDILVEGITNWTNDYRVLRGMWKTSFHYFDKDIQNEIETRIIEIYMLKKPLEDELITDSENIEVKKYESCKQALIREVNFCDDLVGYYDKQIERVKEKVHI